jgi:hypothetical protein
MKSYRLEPLFDERYTQISPVCLQRPSSTRVNSRLEYYGSLSRAIASYLPTLPQIPSLSTFSQIPTLPVPALSQIDLTNFQLLSFPQMELPNFQLPNQFFNRISLPKSGLKTPSLPTFDQLLDSMYSFAGGLSAGVYGNSKSSPRGVKRSFEESIEAEGDQDGKDTGVLVDNADEHAQGGENKDELGDFDKKLQSGKNGAKVEGHVSKRRRMADDSESAETLTSPQVVREMISAARAGASALRDFSSNILKVITGSDEGEDCAQLPSSKIQRQEDSADSGSSGSSAESPLKHEDDVKTVILSEREKAERKILTLHRSSSCKSLSSTEDLTNVKDDEECKDPKVSTEALLPLSDKRLDYFVSESMYDSMVLQVGVYISRVKLL